LGTLLDENKIVMLDEI